MSDFSNWLDEKIAQTEQTLGKLEKDPAYYSLYDVIEGMLKIAKTCRKQYDALEGKHE